MSEIVKEVLEQENEQEANFEESEEEQKTFTQEQVSKMMAKEKREGKNSVLKALGFSSLEEAKKKIVVESGEVKPLIVEENKEFDAKKRYEYLVHCIKNGVEPEDADDVVDLVLKRMDEDDEFEDKLKEFKKAKPSFFSKSQIQGTGNSPKGKQSKQVEESLGAKLGKQAKTISKNPYFDR